MRASSQTELVKITGIDRSTLADLVARLMAQGYVQRRRTKEDARTNSIRLTPIGKKMLKQAQAGAEEVDQPAAGHFAECRTARRCSNASRRLPPKWTRWKTRNRKSRRGKLRPRKGR